MYEEPENNFKTELSVYDIKYKDDILYEHGRKQNLPFFVSMMLIIIKFLYFNICIIPKNIYLDLKNYIVDLVDDDYKGFVTID